MQSNLAQLAQPPPVTFKCVQSAIQRANKTKCPLQKRFAWAQVYELSKQYKQQEDASK